MVGPPANDPGTTFRAAAKTAIASGNQAGALALLRELIDGPPEAAAALTPVVAEALIATARAAADERDRAAQLAYLEAQAKRVEIGRLIETAPLDADDLAWIRRVIADQEQQLRTQANERREHHVRPEGEVARQRLGDGWIERYWVGGRRWGPYLRARWREAGHKRMRYIGKLPDAGNQG